MHPKSILLIVLLLISTAEYQLTYCQTIEDLKTKVQQDYQNLSEALEKLYEDKGVLLVDLADGKTQEGIDRINNVFEGVGNPSDRPRTMIDVHQPLVHFGYLNEVPIDPFLPDDAAPEWNTYVYFDEEDTIPGRDDEVDFFIAYRSQITNTWVLASPGEDHELFRNFGDDDISLSRYQYYIQSPKSELLIQQSRDDMLRIGKAIEQLRHDKGELLIDGWDDDKMEGRERLRTIFEGVGDLPESQRHPETMIAPLVHFGYLDELPFYPVWFPYPFQSTNPPFTDGIGINLLTQRGFFYADEDPNIPGTDISSRLSEAFNLKEGEWLLYHYAPNNRYHYPSPIVNYTDEINLNDFVYVTSRDIRTSGIDGWELY